LALTYGVSDVPAPRPLPVLRAAIDALDRELLQLAARRMAVVAEVAAYKRAHGLRVRDPQREREVLAERARDAAELGLPAGEVEAIFRLLLRASREHQAALRAEVPPGEPARTVAVVGGHGRIGALVARLFGDLGHRVLVCDLDTELGAEEAAAAADVTVVSVPIEHTEAVIRAVGPHVPGHGLLMDVTSVKQGPVRAMLEATRASVVGTHPMFGASVHSLQGQRVVLCRGRGDAWADWVARAGLPLEETLRFTSPAYLLELYVTARHFAQSPALYGPLEMRNPELGPVTDAFRGAAAELADVLRRGDQAAFAAVFDEVRAFFGDFTATALEQSSHLIDRIVERS
jgi:chorismate mutase/prephenate dehydrogenase